MRYGQPPPTPRDHLRIGLSRMHRSSDKAMLLRCGNSFFGRRTDTTRRPRLFPPIYGGTVSLSRHRLESIERRRLKPRILAHSRAIFVLFCSAPGDEFAVFLMEAPSEDGSVLTKASIDALWEIHALVLGIEVCEAHRVMSPLLRGVSAPAKS